MNCYAARSPALLAFAAVETLVPALAGCNVAAFFVAACYLVRA